jgi:hypothetical protein
MLDPPTHATLSACWRLECPRHHSMHQSTLHQWFQATEGVSGAATAWMVDASCTILQNPLCIQTGCGEFFRGRLDKCVDDYHCSPKCQNCINPIAEGLYLRTVIKPLYCFPSLLSALTHVCALSFCCVMNTAYMFQMTPVSTTFHAPKQLHGGTKPPR